MNDTELLLYAFINDCPRLIRAVQDDALKLIDVSDNKYTFIIDGQYLPTEQDYMDFIFDLDDSQLIYQIQLLHGCYFIRIYT
jgi:hypothetical protein